MRGGAAKIASLAALASGMRQAHGGARAGAGAHDTARAHCEMDDGTQPITPDHEESAPIPTSAVSMTFDQQPASPQRAATPEGSLRDADMDLEDLEDVARSVRLITESIRTRRRSSLAVLSRHRKPPGAKRPPALQSSSRWPWPAPTTQDSSTRLGAFCCYVPGFTQPGMEQEYSSQKVVNLQYVTGVAAIIGTLVACVWSALYLPSQFLFFEYGRDFWRLQVGSVVSLLPIWNAFVALWAIAAAYRLAPSWAARHGETCHLLWTVVEVLLLALPPNRIHTLLGSTFADERRRFFLAAAARNFSFRESSYSCRAFISEGAVSSMGGGVSHGTANAVPRCFVRSYEAASALGIVLTCVYISTNCRMSTHKLFALLVFVVLAYAAIRFALGDLDSLRTNFVLDVSLLAGVLAMTFLSARRHEIDLRKEFAQVYAVENDLKRLQQAVDCADRRCVHRTAWTSRAPSSPRNSMNPSASACATASFSYCAAIGWCPRRRTRYCLTTTVSSACDAVRSCRGKPSSLQPRRSRCSRGVIVRCSC